jgi:hypothetical protein
LERPAFQATEERLPAPEPGPPAARWNAQRSTRCLRGKSTLRLARLPAALIAPSLAIAAACAPVAPTAASPSLPAIPAGWEQQPIDSSAVELSLPPDWLAFDEDQLADPETRANLEDRFPGAEALFAAVAAQGSRVRLVFVGVDPAPRGGSVLPPTVAVVAVEPRVPSIGLGLGADLVLDGLDRALAIETTPDTESIETPVGSAVRFSLQHRIAEPGVAGIPATLDGALVTADDASFLMLRNVDASVDEPLAPSLEDVLRTLRDRP